MRKLATLLVMLAAVATLRAQAASGIFDIPPQQCVWHAGDNPAWAARTIDESGWQHLSSDELPSSAFLWVRCPIPLANLRALGRPALEVGIRGAYQEFFAGSPVITVGNLRTGSFTESVIRVHPLPLPLPASPSAVVAFRITQRPQDETQTRWFALAAGDPELLQADIAQTTLASVKPILPYVVLYCVMGVLGCVALGLFLFDQSRRDLLWLSLYCITITALRVNTLALAALADYPSWLQQTLYLVGNFGFVLQVGFFFALVRKRIPAWVWAFYVLSQLADILLLIQLFLAPGPATRLNLIFPPANAIALSAWTLTTLVPFLAFWPWTRIPSRLRLLALCCFLWGMCDFVYFLVQTILVTALHRPHLYGQYAPALYDVRAFVSGGTVILILTLLFRDHRRIIEERAVLAGEMASASEIQRYLIPEKLPPTPGLTIRSVYHPSREVGGDFFQVLPDPRDGSTLIVIGDVAGKGLKAGMLAALIVGAIRTAFKFTSDPGKILALLNERLQGRGLVTCLAIRIAADGQAEVANAGHLSPYIDGKELALDGALPLGALPDISFPISPLRLNDGQSLLFVSDGVVEAQSTTGELFGFERTAAISTQSAEAIARAAQQFGQEDDITVLTLTFTPAEVAHA